VEVPFAVLLVPTISEMIQVRIVHSHGTGDSRKRSREVLQVNLERPRRNFLATLAFDLSFNAPMLQTPLTLGVVIVALSLTLAR
jgi:hypothetical protein